MPVRTGVAAPTRHRKAEQKGGGAEAECGCKAFSVALAIVAVSCLTAAGR